MSKLGTYISSMILVAIMLLFANFAFDINFSTAYAASINVNIALGNPSNANNDLKNKDNYLLEKPQYVLSYNNKKGEANWVSWHLDKSDIGNVPRSDFHPENDLPKGFNHVLPSDYSGSNYDRGHLCNAKDRSRTKKDMDATFSMANMLPQTGDLNRFAWEKLESYCRNLTTKGNEMYIIAGGYGSKGTIGKSNKVNVPSNCWKIILVLPQGNSDLKRIDKSTRVIAVDMPNRSGITNDTWQKYITTVNQIEKKTGYTFFSEIPKDIQNVLKSEKDYGRAAANEKPSTGKKGKK
jgi:endonuclease G, mitochondrial